MVRIKHRYLLVNILYPGSHEKATAGDVLTTTEEVPWTVKIRGPTSDKVNAKVLVSMIRKSVEDLFGDYGSGMIAGSLVGKLREQYYWSNLIKTVKYFSAATSTAIIRVARAHYRLLWAALSFVTKLPSGQSCVMQVVRVSGTIKKSEEEAIRRAKLSILRAQAGTRVDGPDVDMLGTIEDDEEECD